MRHYRIEVMIEDKGKQSLRSFDIMAASLPGAIIEVMNNKMPDTYWMLAYRISGREINPSESSAK